jgi:hypothetical protein
VYFQNQKFFDHTSFSPPLWLLFLKNKEEEEKKRGKKEEKKASNFQSCRLLFYTHTYKELAQRRRSKTERRRATTLK